MIDVNDACRMAIARQCGRREFLRAGLCGLGSLSLSGLLRLRADAALAPRERTAVILVWLPGGRAIRIPRWQTWARAAKAKLDALLEKVA